MAPLDLDIHSNLPPLAFLGSQVILTTVSLGSVLYYFNYAHSSLGPAKHTRSKHANEHKRLPLFLGLAIISGIITLTAKYNWLASTYYDWAHKHDAHIPNTLWEAGYNKILEASHVPLGLWFKDSRIIEQYYYGIMENASSFGLVSQILVALVPWSVYVGIQGHHLNIPIRFLLAFVQLAQLIGLSFATNLFFIALILTPVPLIRDTTQKSKPKIPDPFTLVAPALGAMIWIVVMPAFLDYGALPMLCYFAFLIMPLVLTAIPKLSSKFGLAKSADMVEARKTYLSIFRILTLCAIVIHATELINVFISTSPPKRSLKHSYLWHPNDADLVSQWQQFQRTTGKIVGAWSDDPILAATLWDLLLTGLSLSVWSYCRKIRVGSILHCFDFFGTFDSAKEEEVVSSPKSPKSPRKKKSTVDGTPNTSGPRKRTNTKKGAVDAADSGETLDAEDGAYVPSSAVKAQADAFEPLFNHEAEQKSMAGGVSWVLFLLTGLASAFSSVLGAELSGG
jgi:hypothetical protein